MTRYGSRYNTWRYNPSRDANSALWLLGGATGLLVVFGIIASRSPVQAQIPPPPPQPVTPRPTPRPLVPDMTFTPEEAREIGHALVRQSNPPTESAASVRVLQQQLQDLGYAVTRVDGRQSEELNREIRRYIANNTLPQNIDPIELMRAVDAEYLRVFGARGYV